MHRIHLLITALILVGAESARAQQTPSYRNPSLPVDARVTDLLARMSLEEKVAQLLGAWQRWNLGLDSAQLFVDRQGKFIPSMAGKLIRNGLGQMGRQGERHGPRAAAEYANSIQRWLRDSTRLGIPMMFHDECLHGHMARGGTSYPQAIALASTWNPLLVEQVFSATAAEVRARGGHHCLAPVLDLARDPRWGRTEETYGEDPYLTSRIGVAAVRGMQGRDSIIDRAHVVATTKHFAVHGQPEAGTNAAPGNYSERVIRETFLRPFEAVVTEAKVHSVMPSYNEIDGIPSHSNDWLLKQVLRQEWGFKGVVVSDYFGIAELGRLHHIVASDSAAARVAINAGVDMDLPFGIGYKTLVDQVKSGTVPQALVDQAARRVLRLKFLLGLFDDPFVDPDHAERLVNNEQHRALALQAAREAITLLKNDGRLLPLSKTKYKRVAVIGPNAAVAHLGGYSGDPGRRVSILDGVRTKLAGVADVVYSEGVKITETPPVWEADSVALGDPVKNARRIAEAVEIAERSDVIIVVVGGNEQTSREAWAPTHKGDRPDLDLLSMQDNLVQSLLATGKPVVAILIHGRPNSINYIAENVPAILEGWYLGQETGTAVADVLFGDYNPGGKLPMTVPRSVGHLPAFYNQKPSAKRAYLGETTQPLFPFGFGLSYSTFTYANLRLQRDAIAASDSAVVMVDVTNTSAVRGDEVVQVYVRDDVASVTRPIKELKGFQRLTFDPRQTRTVSFVLRPIDLAFYDRAMRRVVEPGTFTIMAGGSSATLIEKKLTVVGAPVTITQQSPPYLFQ
jgi:beta-glucosidase